MDPSQTALLTQIPKMVKVLSKRTGRLYYKPIPLEPVTSSLTSISDVHGHHIDHPMVIATVVAGFLGVTIVAILIITIWIRRCHSPKNVSNETLFSPSSPSSSPALQMELAPVEDISSSCSRNSSMEIFPRTSTLVSLKKFQSSRILMPVPEISISMDDLHEEVIQNEPKNGVNIV